MAGIDDLLPHVRRRVTVKDMGWRTPCWIFTGPLRPDGYARVSIKDRMTYLHVYTYTALVGPKPSGDLDHLCRVRHCGNPEHLDPVTRAVNSRRGDTGKNMSDRTHCPFDHAYTPENTKIRPDGSRYCRACGRRRQREYTARKKAHAAQNIARP